jgi:hypothetical protein
MVEQTVIGSVFSGSVYALVWGGGVFACGLLVFLGVVGGLILLGSWLLGSLVFWVLAVVLFFVFLLLLNFAMRIIFNINAFYLVFLFVLLCCTVIFGSFVLAKLLSCF